MLYGIVRALVGLAIRLFYRVEVAGTPAPAVGPVIFLANHPNALIDPALLFVVTDRPVTFLAKEPLFRTPGIGWLLRGLQALPVYRKQDNVTDMSQNEGTFEAATSGLVKGRALMLFPEGKSHSEPALAGLKTGAARIAFRAARRGAPVQLVPVGLTYADKGRFKSAVRVELGPPIAVLPRLPANETDEAEAVRALTGEIAEALRKVTLNLAGWEDLPLIHTADALYALKHGESAKDADRLRLFARGMELLRDGDPETYAKLRREVGWYRQRLDLLRAEPSDLRVEYRRGPVYNFIFRNLAAILFGFPLFALGLVLFFVPFQIPRVLARVLRVHEDTRATAKLLTTLLLAPLWYALLVSLAHLHYGMRAAASVAVLSVPLAMFTRYFYEHRREAARDVRVFLVLGGRAQLKAELLAEGDALAKQIDVVGARLAHRL